MLFRGEPMGSGRGIWIISFHLLLPTGILFCKYHFFVYLRQTSGDIAQLARARDWQSRGQGFDSPYLHQTRFWQ
jgi:hypothetical protein